MNLVDRTGQRNGRLVVVGSPELRSAGARARWFWLCQCDCGNELYVAASRLNAAGTQSCGCLRKEVAAAACRSRATHNLGGSRIFNIWRKMIQRCTSPANNAWPNYGARGIRVCEEWAKDVTAFAQWAESNGYADDLTIERIDNAGNYEPSNCRWATRLDQNRNRRNNFTVTAGGKTMCVSEWAQTTGIGRKVIANRIRAGIAPELAVSMPGHSLRAHFNQTDTTVRERVD